MSYIWKGSPKNEKQKDRKSFRGTHTHIMRDKALICITFSSLVYFYPKRNVVNYRAYN